MKAKIFFLLLFLSIITLSCQSLIERAPPINIPTNSANYTTLKHGRNLYIGKCTKCHSAEPILKYPLHLWNSDILPDMNARTNLTQAEARDLQAYIKYVFKQK